MQADQQHRHFCSQVISASFQLEFGLCTSSIREHACGQRGSPSPPAQALTRVKPFSSLP